MKLATIKKSIYIGVGVLTLILGLVTFYSKPSQAASGLSCLRSTNDLIATTSKDYGNCFATSTFLYTAAGTGTTTISFYSQNIDNVGLDIAYAASSTASILNWRREVSGNGVDWYSVGDIVPTVQATTTYVTNDASVTSWPFASSTAGTSNSQATINGYTAKVSSALKHVDVFNLQAPYTRFVFYTPTGAGAGAIHVHIMGKVSNTI